MIRNALLSDWNDIAEIYTIARRFMKSAGNPTQWGDTDPSENTVRRDIRSGNFYVIEMDGRIQAVFSMIPGIDPTYLHIDGAWLNDNPYAAVHRVASRGEVKGLVGQILTWTLEQYDTVRIDTHEDNIPMQRALAKAGFTVCGRILAENGTPRIAYQKTVR